MPEVEPARRYAFGIFEADATTGELRRQGIRIRLKAQPFQLLLMLLERPGELVLREEICRRLWPEDTFVDFEHGVNSAINRLREAMGDSATSPRFIETLPRRGYRFIAPVRTIDPAGESTRAPDLMLPASEAVEVPQPVATPQRLNGILARPEDLPRIPAPLTQAMFVLLQVMYLVFYVSALANLDEIHGILAPISPSVHAYLLVVVSAVLLIPVRTFTALAVLFRAPNASRNLLRLWPFLLAADILWALSPLLLLHHISGGLAYACIPLLVYSPFAQRSLVLMGARSKAAPEPG